jgi:hypothetical protein
MEMSGKVVHRFYWDYEKEERWLNEMASRGWHFTGHRRGGYHFEQGEPGEWIYRIELLPADPGSAASQEYLSLLLDTGAEAVTTRARWVYLRRPAALGSFELFSDLESRIGHYRRVLKLLTTALATLVGCAGALFVVSGESGGLAFQIPMVILALAMVVLAVQAVRALRRARGLEAQLLVHE